MGNGGNLPPPPPKKKKKKKKKRKKNQLISWPANHNMVMPASCKPCLILHRSLMTRAMQQSSKTEISTLVKCHKNMPSHRTYRNEYSSKSNEILSVSDKPPRSHIWIYVLTKTQFRFAVFSVLISINVGHLKEMVFENSFRCEAYMMYSKLTDISMA